MSAATASRAEIAKLARLLGLDGPETLAFAQDVPAPELCAYREAVTELLYDDDRALLQRAADAARLLPASTLAAIGEHSLGSLICARMTSLLDAERAVEISQHFPVDFLARLAAELDPRRAVAVITAMPPERVLEIALVMVADGEYVAMGRFVAELETSSLATCLEALSDEDLLRVGFVLEGKERLPEIVELLGLRRAQRMLDRAESLGLGEEARDLLDHLDARQRKQLRGRRGPSRRPARG